MALTAEQEAQRKLGGSRIAGALGLSRWKTPLDIYLELKDPQPKNDDEEMSDDALRGTLLEDGLRQWASVQAKTAFVKAPIMKKSEWFTYSPDGLDDLVHPPTTLLEIKSPSPWTAHEWATVRKDEVLDLSIAPAGSIPTEYMLQGAWGLFVCDLPEAIFAALVGGYLRLYRLKRDPELEVKLVRRATEFIERHVLPGVPPPAQYGDENNLKRLFPKPTKKHIAWNDLTDFQRSMVADYLRLLSATADAEKQVESSKVLIKEFLGEHSGITKLPPELGYERIDYNSQQPGMHAGTWKQLALKLLEPLDSFERQKWLKQYTPAVGNRPLTAYRISKKATP